MAGFNLSVFLATGGLFGPFDVSPLAVAGGRRRRRRVEGRSPIAERTGFELLGFVSFSQSPCSWRGSKKLILLHRATRWGFLKAPPPGFDGDNILIIGHYVNDDSQFKS